MFGYQISIILFVQFIKIYVFQQEAGGSEKHYSQL